MMSDRHRWRLGLFLGDVALVALAFLALSAAAPALGAGGTIRIQSASVATGESAGVRLEGVGFAAPGLGAITVDVSYDPEAVAVTACEADPENVFDLALCNHEFAPDTIRVSIVDTQGKTGDFVLAEITFEPTGEAGHADLDVSVVTLTDPAGATLDALTEDGSLSISGVSESVEPPAPSSEPAESAVLTSEGAGEAAAPAGLPATGGAPPLETGQPWLYLTIAALCLGIATVTFALIRKRWRA